MQLTQFTDYSLRVLMYLAQRKPTELVTINEISTQFSVPRNHLVKIVNNLVKQGWIESLRGRNGGLRLHQKAKGMGLGYLISTLEKHPSLIDCSKTNCILDGHCSLKKILNQAMQQFYQWLDGYTLQDMMAEPTATFIQTIYDSRV